MSTDHLVKWRSSTGKQKGLYRRPSSCGLRMPEISISISGVKCYNETAWFGKTKLAAQLRKDETLLEMKHEGV
jgi:hypothetical protein